MKFIERYEFGKPAYRQVYWNDHWPSCEKCREVDLEKSASFVKACATGSQLINEEMIKRQAPVVRQKRKEEREWAQRAGVFHIK